MINITIKMVKDWIYLYQTKKLNCKEIAKRYNINAQSVRYYLKQNGVKTSRIVNHSYKNKNYDSIALYDIDDNLCYIFDNAKQMSKELNLKIDTIYSAICRIKKGTRKYMRINKNKYKLYLFKENDEVA